MRRKMMTDGEKQILSMLVGLYDHFGLEIPPRVPRAAIRENKAFIPSNANPAPNRSRHVTLDDLWELAAKRRAGMDERI
jgi:hypothetical protein